LSSTKSGYNIRSTGILVNLSVSLLFLLLTDVSVSGQIVVADSVSSPTVRVISPQDPDVNQDTILHSQNKAILYSAILPGLGQIYNKKYWKVPIIYGAGGAMVYFIGYNHLKYKKFKEALYTDSTEPVIIDGRPYPPSVLARGRDFYRRYRDLSVLAFGAIYFLNIVDAMVDANFFYYDVSDDLSLNINPAIFNTSVNTSAFGLTFRIGF